VLDNHSVELGTQERGIVLRVPGRRTIRAFLTVPREFDISPEFPSWGKFTLATTLCTSPHLAHLLSVIKQPAMEIHLAFQHANFFMNLSRKHWNSTPDIGMEIDPSCTDPYHQAQQPHQ
jgi:hypothetical protein